MVPRPSEVPNGPWGRLVLLSLTPTIGVSMDSFNKPKLKNLILKGVKAPLEPERAAEI